MDWIGPFVLAGAVAGSDYASTKPALSRGAIERNPLVRELGLEQAMVLRGAAIAGTDLLIQKHRPGWKWYWRVGLVIVSGAVVYHNHRTMR